MVSAQAPHISGHASMFADSLIQEGKMWAINYFLDTGLRRYDVLCFFEYSHKQSSPLIICEIFPKIEARFDKKYVELTNCE